MAAPTTTDNYDEYVSGVVNGDITRVDSWNLGLYNDSDNIVATSDMANITTEPSGSGYATKSISLSTDSSLVVGTDTTIDIVDQSWSGLSFGVPTSVNAFYLSCTVQLDGDGAPTEHLMAVGTLSGGPYDLQDYTVFTATDCGITQTQG